MKNKKIGFIGQGYIGKNYADDFENRGINVARYSLEGEYKNNKKKIEECDIVFVAVPTPTTPRGFDDSIVRSVLSIPKKGATVVIKSTILPGATESMQAENKDIYLFHSPEFLTEARAAEDAGNPDRNIVGIPEDTKEYRKRAQEILDLLPDATFEPIYSEKEAEFIKYGGNNWGYVKVVYINMLYDLTQKHGCDWNVMKTAMAADPRIGSAWMSPLHESGHELNKKGYKFNDFHLEPVHKTGRGAGGHCFIKDFEAFLRMYEKEVGDAFGVDALKAVRDKNVNLLLETEKDLDLLEGVYGDLDKLRELN